MTWLEWLVVVMGIAATAGTVAWFLGARRFPERAASHDEPRPPEDESGRGAQPGDVVERPAGPGAESQRVDGRGPLRPGP
jgi:hypothetical protein